LRNVEWTTQEGTKNFDIEISSVLTTSKHLLGATLTFIEKNDYKRLTEELESTRLELARVSRTLEDTKSELSITYKELESAHKELEIVEAFCM
jgi:two-component system CheB/CheR fusion protein